MSKRRNGNAMGERGRYNRDKRHEELRDRMQAIGILNRIESAIDGLDGCVTAAKNVSDDAPAVAVQRINAQISAYRAILDACFSKLRKLLPDLKSVEMHGKSDLLPVTFEDRMIAAHYTNFLGVPLTPTEVAHLRNAGVIGDNHPESLSSSQQKAMQRKFARYSG